MQYILFPEAIQRSKVSFYFNKQRHSLSDEEMDWLCFFLPSQCSNADRTATSSSWYLPPTCTGRKKSCMVWAELSDYDTNLSFERLSSLFFLTIDILCGVTIFFVSDALQFHVCKMELIFLCFRRMF